MKKTLAALIAFGLFSGAASAQSFVQLRGNLDAGFIKESGSDASMGSFMCAPYAPQRPKPGRSSYWMKSSRDTAARDGSSPTRRQASGPT